MMRAAVSELPRLLFCCFDVVPGPSAISRRLTEYIKGLSERFQVVVLSAKTPDHPHIERYHGARLLRVPVGSGDLPARSQTFDRAVRRQLESEDYGLVHFFDPFAGYALCERRSELGYRLVYDACTFPSVELPLENPALASNRRFVARVRRQELFCLMNADGVVVGSPLTADYVAGLGVDRAQVHVLRAPVDLEPFTPERMGKPDATPMKVMHLGRATRGQGLELLLEAMHLALQTVDLRLTLVGPKNPEAQARLEALVGERRLTGKVEFQDPVAHDDIHKVLATADVGALTLDDVERNQQVGTPLARLGEYLAAGRPVIAADVAAARALLPPGSAVLYRPGDAGSLADALVQLASDAARRVKLGAAARAAAAEWDSARVRLELLKVYAEVTGATPEAVDAAADPFEPTQMGSLPADSGEVTQLGARGRTGEDSNVGTNKVKTDPAISAGTDSSTDAAARAERPPIMGIPLREDTPPEGAEAPARQAVTEPGARPSSEPPVVMGAPIREPESAPPSPASVAAALAGEAEPSPTAPPPVTHGAPLASFDDEVRTDLRTPAEPGGAPQPMPSVPTVPEAVDPTSPEAAPTPAVFVPPLSEAPPPLPDEDEPFLPGPIATAPQEPGPPSPTGSSPGVAGPCPGGGVRPTPAGGRPATPRASSVDSVAVASGPAGDVSATRAPATTPTQPVAAALKPSPVASTPAEAELPGRATPSRPGTGPATPDAAGARPPMASASTAPSLAGAIGARAGSPEDVASARPGVSGSATAADDASTRAGASNSPGDTASARADTTSAPPAVGAAAARSATPGAPATTGSSATTGAASARPSVASAPTTPDATSAPDAGAARFSGAMSDASGRPEAPAPSDAAVARPTATAAPTKGATAPPASIGAPGDPPGAPLGTIAPPPIPPRRTTGTVAAAPPPEPAKPAEGAGSAAPPKPRSSSSLPAMQAPPLAHAPIRPDSTGVPAMSAPAPAAPAPARTSSAATTAPAHAAPARTSSTSIPALAAPAAPTRSSSAAIPAMAAPAPAAPARTSSTAIPAMKPPAPAAPVEDEVDEIDSDEVMDVDESSDTADEIMEADEAIQTVDTDPSPPPSALDPWLAQLVHGYCPPESNLFDRHTPPTTMPGRDT
ncbi:MAG: glycosyltransferase [Myxococcota bacterium]